MHQASSIIDTAGVFYGRDALDNRIAWVLTYRGDKAVRLTVYEERAEALEALGLQE